MPVDKDIEEDRADGRVVLGSTLELGAKETPPIGADERPASPPPKGRNRRGFLGYAVLTVVFFVLAALFWQASSSPYQFYFAFFAAVTAVVLYVVLVSESTFSLRIRFVPGDARLAMSLVAFAFLALVYSAAPALVLTPLAVIVTAFLPGYVLLEFLPWQGLGRLEKLVVSFVLSVPLSSVIFLVVLQTGTVSPVSLALGLFLASLLPLLRRLRRPALNGGGTPGPSFHWSDLIGLLLLGGLFVFAFVLRYPNLAPPGVDAVRLFTSAQGLVSGLPAQDPFELFFLLQWAQIIFLAGPPADVFQGTILALGFIVIPSFYIMAKKYLGDVDRRLAILATIVWTTFSGLGWIPYFQKPFAGLSGAQALAQLSAASTASYYDTWYGGGSWIWLWYRPITLDFTILFVLMYLLKVQSLGRKSFLLVGSLAVFGLHYGHYPEFVIFAAFVLAASLVMPSSRLRLREMLLALFVGTIASALIPLLLPVSSSLMSSLLDVSVVGASFLIMVRRRLAFKLPLRMPAVTQRRLYILVFVILVFYISLTVVSSITQPGGYSATYQTVPLEYYPMLLGVAGVLAVLSLPEVARKRNANDLMIFVLLFFLAVIIGRIITFTNLYIFTTSYFERRLVPVSLACAALLSPLAFSFMARSFPGKKITVIALLFVLVLGGTSSTFLAIESQSLNSQYNTLSPAQQQALALLKGVNSSATLLTITPDSSLVGQYVPLRQALDTYSDPLWAAQTPEVPLNMLGYSPVSVLVAPGDMGYLKYYYPNSFLGSLVSGEIPAGAQTHPTVVNLPSLGSTVPNSPIVLVLANETDPSAWYASELLSSGRLNYTTALENDLPTIESASTIIAPTEQVASYVMNLAGQIGLNMSNLVVLNSGGYGAVVHDFVQSPMWNVSTEGATILTDGQPAQKLYGIDSSAFTVVPGPQSFGGVFLMTPGSASSWVPEGVGNGTIGAPRVTEVSGASGNESLLLTIPRGNLSQWQLSRYLNQPTDFSAYDFVSFSWLGNGGGNQYVVEFDGPGFYYWYSFTDSWKGWKQVLLPMHSGDGQYLLNGVSLTKITTGKPDWSRINSVHIRLSAANPDVSESVGVGNFAFLESGTIRMSLRVAGPLAQQLHVQSQSSDNSFVVTSIGANVPPNYSFSNGLSSATIYGDQPAVNYSFQSFPNSTYSVQVSLKVPPVSSNMSDYSLRLRVLAPFQSVTATGILSGSAPVSLPSAISLLPFSSNYSVTSSYDSGVPLLIGRPLNLGSSFVNAYYVNIYPMIESASSAALFPACKLVADDLAQVLPKFDSRSDTTPPAFSSAGGLTFQRLDLAGSVQVGARAGYIVPVGNLSLGEAKSNPLKSFAGLSSIAPLNSTDFIISGDSATISSGGGYYSNVTINNATGLFLGNNIGLRLTFVNGTSTTLTGSLLTFQGAKVNAFLRQPLVDSKGTATVQDLVAYRSERGRFSPQDSNGVVQGGLTFQVEYGGGITVARNVTLAGSYTSQDAQAALNQEEFVFTSGYATPFFVVLVALSSVVFVLGVAGRGAKKNEDSSP